MNYYNEIDPYCVQWLRNLIAAKLIPGGVVDDRDIRDIRPADLAGFTQCHFFAGIAGWPHALALAGVDPDRPLWTGSCPCQPFSSAGRRGGDADLRHLWPHWFYLIRICKPPIILGEQVASAIKQGWLDAVFSDLEGQGYACGAAVLPACGVGAPHIRQRLWFRLGHSQLKRGRWDSGAVPRPQTGCGGERQQDGHLVDQSSVAIDADLLVDSPIGEVGLSGRPRQPRATFWSDAEWIACTDGKWRPAQPGAFPLAHGVPQRVAKLRALGNAIVPQVAAEFIKAAL